MEGLQCRGIFGFRQLSQSSAVRFLAVSFGICGVTCAFSLGEKLLPVRLRSRVAGYVSCVMGPAIRRDNERCGCERLPETLKQREPHHCCALFVNPRQKVMTAIAPM